MVDYVAALDPGELAAQMAAANKTYDEAVVTQLERVADSAVQQVVLVLTCKRCRG
jgi:hypothetical protein